MGEGEKEEDRGREREGERRDGRGREGEKLIFASPSLTQEAAVCCALFESQEWC